MKNLLLTAFIATLIVGSAVTDTYATDTSDSSQSKKAQKLLVERYCKTTKPIILDISNPHNYEVDTLIKISKDGLDNMYQVKFSPVDTIGSKKIFHFGCHAFVTVGWGEIENSGLKTETFVRIPVPAIQTIKLKIDSTNKEIVQKENILKYYVRTYGIFKLIKLVPEGVSFSNLPPELHLEIAEKLSLMEFDAVERYPIYTDKKK